MTVQQMVEIMGLEVLTGEIGLDKEIRGGHVGDLLSYVMAHAKEQNIWVTIQGHLNTVAVASLTGVSAIILTGSNKADDDMVEKAKEEGIPILATHLSSFDFCMACSKWMQME